ncbi:MAG: DUF4388 domain-containing protein [Acidobacteria bacterium]|jgi:hypothetical protein|nr:DUF4388 domain-containing protein [Acidobacteriota bacterium]
MQSTSFIALTGHLNEYPLSDLISILRRQRKTGRLLIEYSISPCSLYFVDGDLVDAQLGSMGGLQAVLVALSQPNASFNFNPLIQPPRQSINESSQKVIFELLGCWDEKTIDVEAAPSNGKQVSASGQTVDATPIELEVESLPQAKEVLALPPSSLEAASRRRNRQILIASAIISLLVSLLTVVALTRWLVKRDISAAFSEAEKRRGAIRDGSELASENAQEINVVVSVEKGRVARAKVLEHRPGMEAYETLALWIARARRYSADASGQGTVTVKINPPD